jgi:hypothetical protein
MEVAMDQAPMVVFSSYLFLKIIPTKLFKRGHQTVPNERIICNFTLFLLTDARIMPRLYLCKASLPALTVLT